MPSGEPCARLAECHKYEAASPHPGRKLTQLLYLVMETAGLVIGVVGLAGLFNSCLEALDKLQSYRTFGNDSHILDTRFNATKARFERWGPGVGIERGQLMHPHHPALDDKVSSDAVAKLLHVIVEAICNPGNVASHRARGVGFDSDGSLEGGRHTLRNVTHESRKKKVAWALWGKGKRSEQVEIFETLVQQLHNLAPPSTGNDPWSVPKRDVPSTNTLTKGTVYIAPRGRRHLTRARGRSNPRMV
jgi:hypothetical protein